MLAVHAAKNQLNTAITHFQTPIIAYVSEVTNVCFAYCASFLIKITHLLPSEYRLVDVEPLLEDSIKLLGDVPGKFCARVLRQMLDRSKAAAGLAKEAEMAGPTDADIGTGWGDLGTTFTHLAFPDFLQSSMGDQSFNFDIDSLF